MPNIYSEAISRSNFPASSMRAKYFAFEGGEILTDPALSAPPGSLLYGKNYEVYPEGGYRRIDGFERYDGRTKPSESIYWILEFQTGTVATVDTNIITGSISGATAELISTSVVESGSYAGNDAVGYMVIALLTDSFQVGENIQVSSSTVAVAKAVEKSLGASTDALDATYSQASIERARSKIGTVTGSGAIRGVWVYNGVTYAFRNNAGGTACIMHKASATGWSVVDLGSYIKFDRGSSAFSEGDTIKQNGTNTTAIVRRIVVRAGTYAIVDAEGLFVLSDVKHGTASATITAGGSGYTGTPTVAFSAPPDGMGVASTTITAGGSGYTTAPTVTFAAAPVGGTTTVGTAIVSAGSVTAITITTKGSGYLTAPTISFGGPGTSATATATLDDFQTTGTGTIAAGAVTGITITNIGSNYTSAPTITITGGGGADDATATATLDAFANNQTLYKYDTTLSGGINASVTVIPVTDVTDFPDAGTIAIGAELITYTGKTGSTSLTGCVRGSSAVPHLSGAAVLAHRALSNEARVIVTLVPSGRYKFVNYNFGGSAATNRMYGCDGFNPSFEYDGTYWVPIFTGMSVDTPVHISSHKKQLFLAFHKGSLQHSGIGEPYSWTVISGAAELGTGDEITGLQVMRGDAMAIFNRNRTYILYGTSSLDWNLKTFSNQSGAVEHTIQDLSEIIYLDDRGITNLSAVNAFGDFAISSLSKKIKPVIDSKIGTSISSVRVRSKGQYRLFFTDGTAIYGTFAGNKLAGFIRVDLGKVVYTVCSAEDSDGNEILFFGSDDGYVYQMDKGTSFDGSKVEAMLRLSYYHYDTPTRNKRFRKIHFEMSADTDVTLKFVPAYSYDDPLVPAAREQSVSISGGGGYWNIHNWNTFNWSSAVISTAENNIEGVGTNMGLLILSEATYEQPHTLQGVTVHYSPRRIRR